MRVLITGRHMEMSAALRRYIETRMKRLERYGVKLEGAQVVLDVEKYRHTAELTLSLNGATIQGRASTNEMYASIDQLFDKISRQVGALCLSECGLQASPGRTSARQRACRSHRSLH